MRSSPIVNSNQERMDRPLRVVDRCSRLCSNAADERHGGRLFGRRCPGSMAACPALISVPFLAMKEATTGLFGAWRPEVHFFSL
jgi:hypothetical protein